MEKYWNSVSVPDQTCARDRQARRIFFQNELTSAADVVVQILFPVDGSHVKVENVAIFGRQFVHQNVRVAADEVPLVSREKVQSGNRTVGFVVQAELQKRRAEINR